MKISHIQVVLGALIAAAIALVLIVIVDLGQSLFFPASDPRPLALYQFDEDLLMTLKPNLWIENNGIVFQTNEASFRGRPLLHKPDLRVMVYGDSNVMARFSKLEQTFPYRLEQYLKEATHRRIEVINAGVTGYGPDQELIRFKREAEIFHPQMAIFVIFADNDYGDLIRNKIYDVDTQGLLERMSYKTTVDEVLKDYQSPGLFFSSLLTVRAIRWLARIIRDKAGFAPKRIGFPAMLTVKERIAEELRRLIDQNQRDFTIYEGPTPRQISQLDDHYDIDLALFPAGRMARHKLRLMAAVLKEAEDFARSKSIRFMIVILPSKTDLVAEKRHLSFRDLERFPDYRNTNLSRPIQEMAVAHKIDFVNLFYIFTQGEPNRFYREVDNHWSDLGQDVAAKIVQQRITAKRWSAQAH